MQTLRRLTPLAPPQVGMQHLADNGAGADDRHLHDNIVKSLRHHARQARHLRTALHLKHADRIGFLEC
jgi:hypothetical protein